MKKRGLILGFLVASLLFLLPFIFAEGMSTEITGECTYYDRGIEYERCCPMGDKINCVSCRDTDGGKDYYIRGQTREWHWNRFERGLMLGSGTPGIIDECVEITPMTECYGTVLREPTNYSYGLCEWYQQIKLYGEMGTPEQQEQCETNCRTIGCDERDDECLANVSRCFSECRRGEITVLREGYCKWVGEYQLYVVEEHICPNGCEDGACIGETECPNIIGWRIEDNECVVDSGCNYDSSKDYYESAKDCIEDLGEVEYPVLEPLPVPDICSDLLIEEDLGDYRYHETTYTRMGPDIYSADGQKIKRSQCCVADYKKGIISIAGTFAYICPLDNRADAENTINWVATNQEQYELGEYRNKSVCWMRLEGNREAILWTKNNYLLAVADIGGALPVDIANAYLEKHNSDLGIEIQESITETAESETAELTPFEEPIDIPDETLFYSCDEGCEFQGKCYPAGYRKEKQYCDINTNEFVNQLKAEACQNNFECKSNVCVSGECVSEGLIQKILDWFKKVFGNEESE